MNLTAKKHGATLSTRTTSRQVRLDVIAARQQTIACAERNAIKESDRKGCYLVYELKGHNLAGPLRVSCGGKGSKVRSRLASRAPNRVGVFLIVGGGMIRRQTNVKGWGGVRAL